MELLRVRAAVQGHELDRRIAAGAGLNGDELLRERARTLVSPRRRNLIALGLERSIAQAECPPGFCGDIPVQAEAVAEARDLISALAEALREERAPNPEGVARARILLTDMDGPLYEPRGDGGTELATALERALQALDPDSRPEPSPD